MRHLVKVSITVTLLYANVAAITRPVAVQVFHLPGLPLPRVLFDAFHIFGVFWYWEAVNRDVDGRASSGIS